MISQSMLPEFDMEMANTRKTLERVPEGKPDFKPHEKSMTMSRLAGHVAEIPEWAVMTLAHDEFDMHPPGGAPHQSHVMKSRQEMLAFFDDQVKKARAALVACTDESMMKPWSLKNAGQSILTMPRIAVMRSFVMNHMIHHRAQLGVYLRLNGQPLPPLYGPTADEQQ